MLFGIFLVAFWGSGAMPAKISEKAAKKVALGAHLGAKISQVGAKMALSCPTWRQDVPKMANLEPKIGNLGRLWEHLGDVFFGSWALSCQNC